MPQWRKLHTRIRKSFDFNEMPDDFTRLLWVLLPLGCDREGKCIDDLVTLRSEIFPMRRDLTLEQIDNALNWFSERGMIIRYAVAGRPYLQVVNFTKFQGKTDREAASVIPDPISKTRKIRSRPDHEQVTSGSRLDVDSDSDVDVEKTLGANAPRARSERDQVVGHLEARFSELAHINPPARKNGKNGEAARRWWTPLWKIFELSHDLEQADALIEQAIARMRRDGLTIAAPASIEKVAISIHGEQASPPAEKFIDY